MTGGKSFAFGKGRWWDEDKHVGLGEIWSAMTDLAVSVLWSCGENGKTITKKAMTVARKPLDYLKNCGY